MEELSRLVETAHGHVVKEFFQSRPHPDPGTFLGAGKLAEIKHTLESTGIKTVVFNDDLSPGQQKKIEQLIPAKVVDRTRLILDIFAGRAQTREGQLQVELAQLNYLIPRLTGSWRGFSQQVGGIGTRGPGERKIEVERRYVRERIKRLKKEIQHVRDHRSRIRSNRTEVPLPIVALVGYTNVGKSTLLNQLVGEEAVYADDKLFATLDPTTRRVKLPGGRTILFSDTVGFIQHLPHSLVAAFHATLEEIKDASLLLHVIDGTAPNQIDQVKTVDQVIKDLGAGHVPMLKVTNKMDKISSAQKYNHAKNGTLFISGKTREGVDDLLKEIERLLDQSLVDVTFQLPHSKFNLLADIYKAGYILSQKPSDDGTEIHVRMDSSNWKRLEHRLQK